MQAAGDANVCRQVYRTYRQVLQAAAQMGARRAQANTTIKSEATQRVEAFSDIDVNLAGAAAATFGAEGAAGAAANGGAPPAGAARPEGADAAPAPAANGSASNGAPARPGGRRKGPAPMPDAAKEVLTSGEAEKKKRRPPNAAAAGAPAPAPAPPLGAADAAAAAVAAAAVWSEEQEVLLVRRKPALPPSSPLQDRVTFRGAGGADAASRARHAAASSVTHRLLYGCGALSYMRGAEGAVGCQGVGHCCSAAGEAARARLRADAARARTPRRCRRSSAWARRRRSAGSASRRRCPARRAPPA